MQGAAESQSARRTQAERRAATRARLLDATLECLIERGYARTTTAEVESRAGVSRGARLHHFPSKAVLLSEAVDHLYARISRRYAEAMERVEADSDRFHAGYRLLWETYADPAQQAVLELFIAARTDPELRAALRERTAGHQRDVRRRANTYFPDLAVREADGLLESLQAAMAGLALRRMVAGESRGEERVLDLIERMVSKTFAREPESAPPSHETAPEEGKPSMSESPITQEMLDFYDEHGYVVARQLVPEPDLAKWIQRLEDIVSGKVPPAEGMLVMKDVMVAKGVVKPGSRMEAIAKVQDYEKDPVLDGYTTHPAILDCVERFVGHDVQTIHTMLINKPPNVDGRHPLHQDLLYFPFRPADRIVASWTALERVTKENGCLVVVPGSHKGELLQHENPPDIEYLNAAYFGAKGIDEQMSRRVHLEMEPGDTVFFHPVLLHGSGRNRTQGFRRAISAHYTALDVEWAWTQQNYGSRKYRIVRGDRAGQSWEGARRSDELIEPGKFVSAPMRRPRDP